jgi:hypothetical protein
MLVLHQLLYVLFTLRGIFMHFLELTYSQDATVPVPSFLLFLYFRKVIQKIFSEFDKTKAKPPIFPDTKTESKAEMEEGTEVATPPGGASPPLATPGHGVGPSDAL